MTMTMLAKPLDMPPLPPLRPPLPSPARTRARSVPPSPAYNRSHGTAKKPKNRDPFYKGYGVVYLPGDINGLTRKLHLLAAEFLEGNTTVSYELLHVLDALLRLKQLARKEYTDHYDCIQT